MAVSKYDEIYKDLKKNIIACKYKDGEYLPSEHVLTQKYNCSRNTVRRAISQLSIEGYVQPHHGKGVRIIHHEPPKYDFMINGTEGFHQVAKRYGYKADTKVVTFTELTVDPHLAQKTNFPEGIRVYFIQRIRSLDGIPKMIDNNLVRMDLVPGLTQKIACGSLFEYIEKKLGMEIATIKRSITVEKKAPFDETYLDLDDYDCLAVMTSRVYNAKGDMFEYTVSRNRPDLFLFNSVSTRNRQTE